MTRHRRRAVAGAVLALALLVVAGSGLGQSSPATPPAMRQVLSARRPIEAGQRITAADLAESVVAVRWASPHQLNDPAAVIGRRAAVDLARGSPLMDSELSDPSVAGARDVSLRLDDASGLPIDPPDGGRADLYLVTPGRHADVTLVLAGALVVASREADGAAVATLRVPPADVPVLIRAEAAGSLRLVSRTRA